MNAKKSPGGEPGLGKTATMGANHCNPHFSTNGPKIQSIRPLSDLLDRALSQVEFHEQQARYHARQAEKHRAVLHSLQGLIPKFQFDTEGEL